MLHRLNKHILDSTEQIHEMSNVMAKFDKYAICRNLSKHFINTLYHYNDDQFIDHFNTQLS